MNEWKKKCVGLQRTWVSKRTVHEFATTGQLIQGITFPTRFRAGTSPSVLDLVFSSVPDAFSLFSRLSPIGLSDHAVVKFLLKWRTSTSNDMFRWKQKASSGQGDLSRIFETAATARRQVGVMMVHEMVHDGGVGVMMVHDDGTWRSLLFSIILLRMPIYSIIFSFSLHQVFFFNFSC